MKNKTGLVLLYSFTALAFVFFAYFLIKNIVANWVEGENLNNFIQACEMLFILGVASLLSRFRYDFSNMVVFCGLFTIVSHFIFGEILGFYVNVKFWDSVLHVINNIIITLVFFSVMDELFPKSVYKDQSAFRIVAVLGVAVLLGVVWEIVEFVLDGVVGSNMQRYLNSKTHDPFMGREALLDTMKDLILDVGGGIVACIIYYALSKKKEKINNIFRISKKNRVE